MKALNRKEVLVNAKANGTLDSFKPLTRDEAFTKKALGLGGSGGGGVVFVNISGNPSHGFTVDKTPAEVHALIESGVTVVCTIPVSEDSNLYLYHSLTKFTYDDDDNRIPIYEFQSLQPTGPYVSFAADDDAAWVGMVVAQVMADDSIAQVIKGFN